METQKLIEVLKAKKLKVSFAESCTGGLIAKKITDISGSSEVFECGVVAYGNDIKVRVLGVKAETVKAYGAVSSQTACEMAEGVRRLSGSDISVSVTGIAGPAGGSAGKPVGTVYIAISTEDGTEAVRYNFGGTRENIREKTAEEAIGMLLRKI